MNKCFKVFILIPCVSLSLPVLGIEASATNGIFLCEGENGVQDVVNAQQAAKRDNCTAYSKNKLSKSQNNAQTAHYTMPPTQFIESTDKTVNGKIALTEEKISGNIYQCFDSHGQLSFVNEQDKSNFSNCELYQGQQNPNQTKNTQCEGQGSVSFAGKYKNYDCADRSYDDSQGSSGGYIIAGSKRVDIEGYNSNYLSTNGSCGGSITDFQGKTFHLEPTKDCPNNSFKEAKLIAQAYLRTISTPITASFRTRQATLAHLINQISREVGVDPYLVHAVISAESAYKQNALSKAGAQGLMQLMPATAARFNVQNAFNPSQNIRGGASYLKYLLRLFKGDVRLALAAYNAGEGNVKKYGNKIPPFIETQTYVPKVLQYYQKYKSEGHLISK